ncbi:MAG: HEAT repeat domain-containing protein [Actinoplanes sp.]
MTKVYVSATFEDLRECRAAVAQAIRQLGLQDVAMESYVAEYRRPLDRCLADVQRCDIYVGVFAWRYGFVPDGHDLSITELEYQAAVEAGKPRLIFLLDEDAPWPRSRMDREPAAGRIEALRERLQTTYLCGMFRDPADLAAKVTASLARLLVDSVTAVRVLSAETRRAYLDQLRMQLRNLDLDTLTPPQNDPGTLRISLSSVFVEPSVRADPPPVELPREWWARLPGTLPTVGDQDPEIPDEVDAETMAMLHDAYRAKPRRPVFDVLSEPDRRLTVLLGDPGAGKSTVARYVALQLAEERSDPRLAALRECLPIVIEVRMYAALRAEGKCSTFLGYLGYRHETGVFDLSPQALRNHLLSGAPTVVIFDGLDEIFDGRRRQEVAEQVAAFALQFRTTRIIVTSRILEYTSRAHGHVRRTLTNAGFEHFTLQDLDVDQISTFLTRWFIGVLQQEPRDAALRSAGLVRDIARSRPLRELAGNPMLLTILAIINRHQVLPRDRWRLYHHAAGVLVEHWDVSRHLGPGGESALAEAEDKQELLRRLAYEMQTGNTGLSGNYIAREDLIHVFVEYLVERYEHDLPTARRMAGAMIDQLRERNFILSLYGSHMYGFVHRTFLEFFAAEAILDKFRHEREWTFDRVQDVFRRHWYEASWREVLRLLAGVLSESDNRDLIELLARENTDWLVTENAPMPWNLALAVQCLAQVRRITRVRSAAELLLRRVVILLEQCAPLIETGMAESIAGLRPPREVLDEAAVLIEEEILPTAAVIGSAWPGREAYLDWYGRRGRWIDNSVGGYAARLAGMLARPADQLPALLGRVLAAEGDVRIANAAVQGLAEAADRERMLGAGDFGPAALDELIRAATTDGRAVVRLAAVEALSRFAADPEVRDVLADRAQHDDYAYVRLAAIQHLGEEFGADSALLPVLRACAEDPRGVVRVAALGLLAALPDPGDAVENHLYAHCERDPDADAMATAAAPLLARSPLALDLRGVLAHRAELDPDAGVRAGAIRLLAREADAVLRPGLFLDRVRLDRSTAVIQAAAEALAADRPGEVRSTLLARLRDDPDEVVRAALPAVLVAVLPIDDTTADDLVARAGSDPDPTVRAALLEAMPAGRLLRQAGRRAAVLAIARDPEEVAVVRLATVQALTPGSPDPDEADALAAMVVTDPAAAVRLAAVGALPRWRLTERTTALLHVAAREDGIAQVRLAALNRLLQDGLDPDLREPLRRLVAREPDAEVFRTAATAALDLAALIGEDAGRDDLLQIVEKRAADDNPEVRVAAVRLMAQRSPVAEHAYLVIRERLRTDTHPDVFAAAADQAGRLFADRPDLPDLLMDRLTDPDSDNRCAAARALARWCRTDDEVRRRLSELAFGRGDEPLRCTTLAALDDAADLPDVRMLLVSALKDREPSVRAIAVRILGRRLGRDTVIRAALMNLLRREENPELRRVLEATLVWTGEAEVNQFPDRVS